MKLKQKLNKFYKMDSKEILKKYCKQKYGNEIIIKTYDIQEVKQIIDFTKQLLIHSVGKSFTAEEVGDMLATKFETIEEAIHYFDITE
ncbi:MAG: hypothetical protein GY749_07590 [Desulfobacteraceae bacterium]|nr:hypothetical protein [Desulfobacteraceae bacterium]